MTYEIQTYTLCQGWINCWTIDEQPQTFATRAEAQAELDTFFDGITSGERAANQGYDRKDFRIVQTADAA